MKAPLAVIALVVVCLGPISRAEEFVAFSPLFTTDTRWGLTLGSRESGFFAVDTRFSGSEGNAASDLFTVDTTSAVIGNATIYGRVTDSLGAGLGGVTVSATHNSVVRAQVATDGDGYFSLNSLPAGSYETWAVKANYLTGIRYDINLPAGGSVQINFGLAIKPAVPSVTPVDRPPEAFSIGPIGTDQLQVYSNGSFLSYGSIDRSKMTVVFTHGWNSNPNEWATNMVAQMITGGFNDANFVAWNWEGEAAKLKTLASGRTSDQGKALGQALATALGSTYGRPIHFIGHSFGTLVNAAAANYLHVLPGGIFPWTLTHCTLLDEGEIGSSLGNIVRLFTSTVTKPIPESYAWVDNYISLVGYRQIKFGVDAILSQGLVLVPQTLDFQKRVLDLHAYAAVWYTHSAANPSGSALGFKQSFEKQGANWAPNLNAPRFGTGYIQPNPFSELYLWQAPEIVQIFTLSGLLVLNAPSAAAGAVQGLGNVVLDIGESIIPNTAMPTGTPVYSGTAGSTPMYYTDNPVQNVPIHSFEVMLSNPGLNFPLNKSERLGVHLLDAGSKTNPPCIWIPISVPTDAAAFSFDFSFAGNPGEDLLSASINGTNVFALEAKYIPTNEIFNSGTIPVDTYTGQDVELFFGLLGGTSSNASVTVNAMRFYSVEPPSVTITPTENAEVVSWPAAATGYALEIADDLCTPNQWSTVTNMPSLVALQNVVTNTSSEQRGFYRLRKP